ncbi:hypothetical protein GTZ99_08290 [Novosphingobium sp. FSY-8]|uniref:SMODS and SLOG-associating 2TM effector domain-containing protein n=1 Tax=Novosphingobium ovatum TaxID=1908523 RepID=A0ABW9XDC9_9SPHN|nr:hypothetical protein [Novosphingobium ovatum]NBC36554.1 hypothetical protein [Novosphingobium ovatum]
MTKVSEGIKGADSAPPRRDYEAQARVYLEQWRKARWWWRWTGIALGVASTLLASVVASNNTFQTLVATRPNSASWLNLLSVAVAILVPVLTALMGALKPQAQAAAYETAARELEKALCCFESDPTRDNSLLADAVARGLDTLNRVGSQ